MQFIIILLLFIIIGGIVYYKTNRKKLEQQIKNDYLQKNREEFNKQLQTEKQFVEDKLLLEQERLRRECDDLCRERDAIQNKVEQGKTMLEQLALRKSEQEQAIVRETELLVEKEKEKLAAIGAMVEEKKNSVQVEVDAFREVEMQKARTAVDADTLANQKWAQERLEIYWDDLARQTYEKTLELADILETIEDYKQKQQAINEAILRQRAIDEQQDFYRVNLSEFAIEDIKLLQEIRQKLHTSDNLNKLIYDVYVSKPVAEMVKRVLQGGTPSGIYKITRLKTGEIYIGKSTNVKDRWVQHCKTVYGAGTIAHSILHTTMAKDGLEQFTFELVEEVPKEKLTEREKYWISFYGSKEYGLNERNG